MSARVWQRGEIILDQYEVLDVVHAGGMGLVHKVHHRGWDVELAVKTPRPAAVEQPEGRRNFETEAATWVALGVHPNIVQCLYVRQVDELPRVFAEWVDGGSLAGAVENGRIYEGGRMTALRRILDVAIQVAWGLEHAHTHELIHQDVKPANVMLDRAWTAKVTDFGLARARIADGPSITVPGASLLAQYGGMTRAYCSPEQAEAAVLGRPALLTRATDVWSWALTVLEMFTGHRPTEYGQAAAEVFTAFLDTGTTDERIPGIPPAVADLLQRCFARNPADRPHRMSELARALIAIHEQEIGAPYPRGWPESANLLADGLSNQALSMLDLGRPREAEHLWDRALRAEPNHVQSVYNRGLHLWRTGRLTDVQLVAALEAVCADDGGDGTSQHLLGLVHLERGAPAEAIEALRTAAERLPGSSDVVAALSAAEQEYAERVPHVLDGHTASVRSVAMTGDGGLVVSGAGGSRGDQGPVIDGTVRLWDTETGRCVGVLAGDERRGQRGRAQR